MANGPSPAGPTPGWLLEVEALKELVEQFPPLTDAQTRELLDEVGEQGLEAVPRRLLVQHHLWLVLEEAQSAGSGEAFPDLFQEGSTALLKIVHGLAPRSPITPEEFRDAVRTAVRETVRGAVEEERAAREADLQWARDGETLALAEAALAAELGRPPADEEMARHLGWTEERTIQMRRAVAEAHSQYDREMAELLAHLEEEE